MSDANPLRRPVDDAITEDVIRELVHGFYTRIRADELHTVLVRTYSDKVAPELAEDSQFMANTAVGYLNDLLNSGWDPMQPRELAITVTNPDGYVPKKSSWKFWQ